MEMLLGMFYAFDLIAVYGVLIGFCWVYFFDDPESEEAGRFLEACTTPFDLCIDLGIYLAETIRHWKNK